MTCNHQWHDATTKAGPEWVCAKCKVTYTESKKAPATPKREWVELTQEEIEDCYGGEIDDFARMIEAKLKEKNT